MLVGPEQNDFGPVRLIVPVAVPPGIGGELSVRRWLTGAPSGPTTVRDVIAVVTKADLAELLPLMRAYCEFYEVNPPDGELLAMSRALIAEPEREGLQLIARSPSGVAVGFATIFWSWSTSRASRIGVMNDLFTTPTARGAGVATSLIAACLERCRERGAGSLSWQTARDNHRAQSVYDRIGAHREEWIDYSLESQPWAPLGATPQM